MSLWDAFSGAESRVQAAVYEAFGHNPAEATGNALDDPAVKKKAFELEALVRSMEKSQPLVSALGQNPRNLLDLWKAAAPSADPGKALSDAQRVIDKINGAWARVSQKPGVSEYAGAAASTITEAASRAGSTVEKAAEAAPAVTKYLGLGLVGAAALYGLFLLPKSRRSR